jgi:ribokinase
MKMVDVVTIGSATMDVFVESDDANIVSVCKKDKRSDFMSYPYGAKVEITDFASNVGGGGVNTAMNFDNLGFKTNAIVKIGDDIYSQGILEAFKETKVSTSSIIQDKNVSTGFSIILTSFQGDRTVLAHRGANACIKKSEIDYDAIKSARLLYIAPLNGDSNKVLDNIVKFAHENNVYVCFNAGTTCLKRGYNYIKGILENAEIVVMNKEEASMATQIQVRPDTRTEKFSDCMIHPDIIEMFKKLKVKDYQIIVITDGGRGAYAYDGKTFFYCPCFDGPVVSTLGAGDAFASTFCASLDRTDKNIGKSLMMASVNSAGVVSEFGATKGFLTFDEIEAKLKNTPDYSYKTC